MNRLALALAAGMAFSSAAQAKIVSEPMRYKHGDVTLQGHIVYDDSREGPRPGMLVFHEWWGLNDFVRDKARELAEQGYVALAVDMYGDGKNTAHPEEAQTWMQEVRSKQGMLEARAQVALEALRAREEVDSARIGAIGFCFGGTSSLALAYTGADLAGIASFHGGLIVPDEKQREQINTSILILHGAQDAMIKQETIVDLQQALDEAEVDWHMVTFGGAKHGFTNPAADEAGLPALGYDPVAAKRSWHHMLQFFEQRFAE